jgi:TRAP-type C4-dicarboxylate transport system permease small subunit
MRKDFFYTPNHIPADERLKNIVFSILLFAYGTYGVWVNDLYIPGKRSRGVHLHDVPAWIMYGAIICACMVMLSVVADHYDTRNNENSWAGHSLYFR